VRECAVQWPATATGYTARIMAEIDEEAKTGAERTLSAALGDRVLLGPAEPLRPASRGGRSSIYRYTALDGPSGTPASVIVKRAVARGAEGYDPDSATSGPARRLLMGLRKVA
jgi:hypothetical protein